jgi:SpoIID/LytB domain protein
MPTGLMLQCRPNPASDWLTYTTVPSTMAWFENTQTHVVTTHLGDASTMLGPVVYRGQVRAALIGPAGQESLTPVVALPMEDYLRSVVPSEMPASWSSEALAAQSVAARSFAEYHRRYAPVSPQWYDVYDDTRSQVFNGTKRGSVTYEYPSTDAAVLSTADQALSSAGRVALTMFASSNGGWTVDGGMSYLVSKADPWDRVPSGSSHAWRTTLSVSAIERTYPSIGAYRSMRVVSRTGLGEWGGRVTSVVLTGTRGAVTVSGNAFRASFNLRSDWFKPLGQGFPRDVTADGNGDVIAVDKSAGALFVYPGDGAGGWRPRVTASTSGWGAYAKVFTAGTWDAGPVSDVMYQVADGDLYLASGNGDGTFATGRKVGVGWQVHDKVFPVGDFDGDGRPDLLARRASDGALILYNGDGNGAFVGARQVGWQWGPLTSILSPGDFDGDGNTDVLARKADGTLWLYPGTGTGRFGTPRQVGTGWGVFSWLTSVGDVDGDGNPDVLGSTADGQLLLYRGNGRGGWLDSRVVGSGWGSMARVLP